MLTDQNIFRVWCETEAAYVLTDWTDDKPTECPNNPAHTITADKTALVLMSLDSEPMGFENAQADSEMSFVEGTRTFTIQPTGTSFRVFVKGISYEFTSAQQVVIPDT